MAETREDFVYLAKLAEQAERCVSGWNFCGWRRQAVPGLAKFLADPFPV